MTKTQEAWAVFWCGMLHTLIHDRLSPDERAQEVRRLVAIEHRCPDGKFRSFSESTIRRRLRAFQAQRLQGFLRKIRSDEGAARAIPLEVREILIELKRELPTRSETMLNHLLQERTGYQVARSTLFRYLKEAELPGASSE